jgi:membrane protein DedA with SNARE-associated domain
VPSFLSAHVAAASFLWGLFKSLMPFPSPSGFVLMAAETARPLAGAREAALRLAVRVVLPGATGVALGGIPYYRWARRGGRESVVRWGHWFGVSRLRVEEFERRGQRRRGLVIWTLFALPLSPTLVAAVAAGLLEAEAGGYAALAFTGAAARCSLLACVGWAFRARFGDPARLVRPWEAAAAAVVVAAAAVLTFRRRQSAARL